MAPAEKKKKKIKKRSHRAHQNRLMHFTNTLDHAPIFLEGVVNEHVFMSLVSLGKKNPALVNFEM